MKTTIRTIAISSLAFSLLLSCKKEFGPPVVNENLSLSSTISTPTCKPSTYAIYQNGSGAWTTVVQKWYSGGKIKNIKLHFTGTPMGLGLNHDEPIVNIDWGQVTYEGNQVRVWDVGRNRLVFRATLDDWGKPVASYLYTDAYVSDQIYVDTSYYYYSGDRLNSFIQIFATDSHGWFYSQGWEQFTFTYNGNGDIASFHRRNEEVTTRFMYNTTPVTKIITDYALTTSFRFLEFLELIKLPMSNAVSSIDMTKLHLGYPPYTFYEKRFFNYDVVDGLVRSYIAPQGSGYQTFYIGWDCSGIAALSTDKSQMGIISNVDQFKKWYPDRAK